MRYLAICVLFVATLASTPIIAAEPAGIAAELDVAQCVVDNDSRGVRKLLDTQPGSPEEQRVAVPLVGLYGACNDNSVVSGTIAWRERAELAAAAAAVRAGRVQADLMAAAQHSGWMLARDAAGSDDAASIRLRMFGDCVVRGAPIAARDLIVSEPGSANETAAITALTPALGQCLAAGKQFSVARGDLRLVVGEPLYHLLSR